MLISSAAATGLLLFANAAQSQGYYPGYVLTSTVAPEILAPQIPAKQAAHLVGIGWHPSTDVKTQPAAGPALRRCQAIFKRESIVPTGPTDEYFEDSACSFAFLIEKALELSGGRTGSTSLIGAIRSIGSALALPSDLDESSVFSPGRFDGPEHAREWEWSTSCGCSSYVGPTEVL